MAAFTKEDAYRNRLDWKILRDSGVALYWRREFLEQDIKWFQEQGYLTFSLDCTQWGSSEEMHSELQRTLSFPPYYGRNLNALNDCLTDLPVPDAGGTVLILRQFDVYMKGAGADPLASGRPEAEGVLDVLTGASRYFLLTARRFLILVQTDDAHTHFERLGCVAAQWNQREWLNKDRGL